MSLFQLESYNFSTPRHIMMAIFHDEDFSTFLSKVDIMQAGRVPFIHDNLLPKNHPRNPKSPKKASKN